MSYLSRYTNGEYNEVWQELCFMNEHIKEVGDVAKEYIDRALNNFISLRKVYRNIGYMFEEPNEVISPPAVNIEEKLGGFEEKYQCTLPAVYKEWHRKIGQVDFRQSLEQEASGELAHLGTHHSFVIVGFAESVSYLEYQTEQLGCEQLFLRAGGPVASNCGPYGIDVRSGAVFDCSFALDEFSDISLQVDRMLNIGDSFRHLFRYGGIGYRSISIYRGLLRHEELGWSEIADLKKYVPLFQEACEVL